MRRALILVAALCLAVPAAAAEPAWSVCFTPGADCTGVIVRELGAAKRTIVIQTYSFTSAPIAKALADAKKRGVDVQVILDKSQRSERYTIATFLTNAGIPVFIDQCCAIAHNKMMVIDGETVITGSFNFTKSAQDRNAENVLVLRDRRAAELYAANWRRHLETSERFEGRSQR